MAPRIAALAGAAVVAAVAGVYVYGNLDGDASIVISAALALATTAGLAVAGAFAADRTRRTGLLGTAAAFALAIAVVAAASVGPLLVPAVVLLVYSMFSR